MVLLTQSTISIIISSTVVCLFTFLLFLSGYVLQQQTVKSLQEALQAPIEIRIRSQLNVPSQLDPVTLDGAGQNETLEGIRVLSGQESTNEAQIVLGSGSSANTNEREPSLRALWRDYLKSIESDYIESQTEGTKDYLEIKQPFNPDVLAQRLSLAYILPIANPTNLCAALLFAKEHRQRSQLSGTPSQPSIVFLYPSDWDHSLTSEHKTALARLVRSEYDYSTLLHPVPISKVWNGVDIESQLLSELARNVWTYDRAMYLRMPGVALDVDTLDEAILTTLTRLALEKEWTKLKAHSRSASAQPANPEILLHAQGRGLMIPKASASKLTTVLRDRPGSIVEEAAYLLLDGSIDSGSESSVSPAMSHLVQRIEKHKAKVCEFEDLVP